MWWRLIALVDTREIIPYSKAIEVPELLGRVAEDRTERKLQQRQAMLIRLEQ